MHDRSDLTTTDSGLVVPAGRGISRRRVVGTAAWAAPTIVVAGAVPAFAFSEANGSTTQLVVATVAASRSAFATPASAVPVWHAWSSGSNPAPANYRTIAAGTAPNATNNPAVLTVTVSGVSAAGAGDGLVQLAVTVPGQTTSGTTRPAAQYDATSTGWALQGTPTFNTTSRDTTFTFLSSDKVVAGQVYPDLVFSVVNTSTAASPTVYAWTTPRTIAVTASAPDGSANPITTSGSTT